MSSSTWLLFMEVVYDRLSFEHFSGDRVVMHFIIFRKVWLIVYESDFYCYFVKLYGNYASEVVYLLYILRRKLDIVD